MKAPFGNDLTCIAGGPLPSDLLDRLSAIVWEADAATWRFSLVSHQAEALLRYPVSQWLAEPDFWQNHLHPDDRDATTAFRRERIASGADHALEYRMVAADGRVLWLRDMVRLVRDTRGRVQQLAGVMVDITERKLTEEALAAAHRELSDFVDNAPIGLHWVGPDGIILWANQTELDVLGYDRDEYVGHHIAEFHVDRAVIDDILQRLAAGETLRNCEARLRCKDGSIRHVQIDSNVFWRDWQFVHSQCFTRDITDLKRAEAALRDSDGRYRLLFESNPHPMWVCDLDTLGFLAVNNAAIERYGYSHEEFLAMTVKDIRPSEEIPRLLADLPHRKPGVGESGGWRHRKKSGEIMEIEIRTHQISFGGRPASLVLATDVTERRGLEERLRQAQKMEAIGQLAGGIAHDFNNLLTTICGYSDLALDRLSAADPLRGDIQEIKRAGERAASLTRQLLAFSRKQVLQPRVLDLNSVVAETEGMLRRLIGEDVRLVCALQASPAWVKADATQLAQVILNLAVNARDAMPQGGRLTIDTANIVLDTATASSGGILEPGSYVLLTVSDAGVGMDAETLSRLFEPFFTTKGPGRGTGLGLSSVYGTIKQSNGHIEVSSELGRGAAFRIFLPLAQPPEQAELPAPRASLAMPNHATVLLVEDEHHLRALAQKILVAAGCTVLPAADGAEALRLCHSHEGSIDLLLTDVVMPAMSGPQLFAELSQRYPKLPVLYISGHSGEALSRFGAMPQGTAFLPKPFAASELMAKIREVFESPPPAASVASHM